MNDSVIYFLVGLFFSLAVSMKASNPKSSTKGTMTTQDRLHYQQSLLRNSDWSHDFPTKYGEITYGVDVPLRRIPPLIQPTTRQINPPNGGCQADE